MRKGGFVLVISILAVTAGCSSGGGTPSGNGGGSVSPGHGSPKAAVEGFITDLESVNGGTAWCDYIQRAVQICNNPAMAHITLTGIFALGNQVIQGTQALVAMTGDVCGHNLQAATTPECINNSDPNKGLPPGAGTFSEAYAAASNLNAGATATAPCTEVNGRWYVDLPGLSTTSPTTTPTTVPTTTPTTTPSPATTTPTTAVP